jgi:hypothetical protein
VGTTSRPCLEVLSSTRIVQSISLTLIANLYNLLSSLRPPHFRGVALYEAALPTSSSCLICHATQLGFSWLTYRGRRSLHNHRNSFQDFSGRAGSGGKSWAEEGVQPRARRAHKLVIRRRAQERESLGSAGCSVWYGRGSQEVRSTTHVFCHCQDIQNRYNLYAALMVYQ